MKTETQQPESHRRLHQTLETMAEALCPFWEWYCGPPHDIFGDHEEMTLWARRAAATALASEHTDILAPALRWPASYTGDRDMRSGRDWYADAVIAFLSPAPNAAPYDPIGTEFVVESVTLKAYGPEATRVAVSAMPDWARPLYDPAPAPTQKFMGMGVVVNPDMPDGKIALVNCRECMDVGLVHLGPNSDLCPATGCTARDKWENDGHGWTLKSAPNHTGT